MNLEQVLNEASDTELFLAGPGVMDRTAEVFQSLFPQKSCIIVADGNTMSVAGDRVKRVLEEAGVVVERVFLFPAQPPIHADYSHIEELREILKPSSAVPLAIGSGTINDIVKRASHECNRRYLVVATAASVDGYTSFGAAILTKGFKMTLECPAPLGIVADTHILMTAPSEMAAAGYADLMSKITAGADWIIADALAIDPIESRGWDMVQSGLREWLRFPRKLMEGDAAVYDAVFEGLAYTGFSMQAMRRSRPASGAEHMLSHIWEMENLTQKGATISHGFKVSVATLLVTALTEVFFSLDPAAFDAEQLQSNWPTLERREGEIQRLLHKIPSLDRILDEHRAKYLEVNAVPQRIALIREKWEPMKKAVLRQLYPFEELKGMLQAAECPLHPADFGLTREDVADTFRKASVIRNRYSILDIAHECGVLDSCAQALYDRGYF